MLLHCETRKKHPRHNTFPLLSPTYRSHQLWTPSHLERVSISENKYHNYLKSSPITPSHRLLCGGKKYGDNGFFLQKHIPLQQKYDRTQLMRSDIRPWDQTIPRPLTTGQILEKESNLPFPSQHPYTSHISQFAVFPDSKMSTYQSAVPVSFSADGNQLSVMERSQAIGANHGGVVPSKVNAMIQTDVSCFNQSSGTFHLPAPSLLKDKTPVNMLKAKAYSNGLRIEAPFQGSTNESQRLQLQTCLSKTCPGIYRWDGSRKIASQPSQQGNGRLQSSLTYPTPSTMYCPPEHPATATMTGQHYQTTSPMTLQALDSVNRRVSTSTAYNDHYCLPITINAGRSRMVFKRETSATLQQTAGDSRGKYAHSPLFSALAKAKPSASILQGQKTDRMKCQQYGKAKCDQATQTDHIGGLVQVDESYDYNKGLKMLSHEAYYDSPHSVHVQQEGNYYNHDSYDPSVTQVAPHCVASPPSTGRQDSYLQPDSAGSGTHYDGDDEDWLLGDPTVGQDGADDGDIDQYSRSNAVKHFHMKYKQCEVPDLRQFSISSGRRHIINGYHAYYWH